jgi:hypothetical protein
MLRRRLLGVLPLALLGWAQAAEACLRGRLVQREGEAPALEPPGGRPVQVDGEQDTMVVLNDPRLAGMEFEVAGRYAASGRFVILPFTTRGAMLVHQDGRRFTVTYWCEVCAIRTYTPGKCMCCQEETELSLQEFTP